MARAYLEYTAKDEAGNVWANAAIYLFAPGTGTTDDPPTGTGITGSVFDVRTGGVALLMPLIADVEGKVAAWLATAQAVDVVVTDNDGTAYRPALSSAPYNFPPELNSGVANVDPADIATDADVDDAFTDHVDTADEHAAGLVEFTPTGDFTATDVQAAIEQAAALGQGQGPGVSAHNLLSGLTTGDDHTQYQKESEKDANNGYAGLDSTGKIAAATVKVTPAGTIASTTLPAALQEVADDGATALAAHEAAWANFAFPLATFSVKGALTATSYAFRFYIEGSWTLTEVRASVGVAPAGATILVDVNKNGSTIFTTQTNRPTIAIAGNTDKADNINVNVLVANDYLTMDVDQVGSTTPGDDLTVQVWARKT